MSRDTWNLDNGPLRGLYRDRENGWIFGVCAGLAEFGNFNVGTVRVIAVICLCIFTWATGLVYIGQPRSVVWALSGNAVILAVVLGVAAFSRTPITGRQMHMPSLSSSLSTAGTLTNKASTT